MPVSTMTNRERIFATIHGEEVDRFPVWLKMTNRTWQQSQPEPYKSMGAEELLQAAGCDLLLGCGLQVQSTNPHVESETTQEDGLRRTVHTTPDGELVSEQTFDPYTESWHPTRFPINDPEELAASRWFCRDTEYSVADQAVKEHRQAQKELEEKDAVTITGVGPSPLMHMVEHQCGPITTHYLMQDAPELFREVIDLMHADRMRHLRARLPHLETDTFWMTENTSTTLISPRLFHEFCMPHLTEYGNLILENDIIPVHHMCGTLNALLEMIDELPALVNEAYTTPPVGDTTLAEGRERMPSKALIGGTNATLLTQPLERIVRTVEEDLERCPDRRKIFLTSAGVLPAPVSFEKTRRIMDAFKAL